MKYIYVTIFITAFLLTSCQWHKVLPEGNIVYIQIGDSITSGDKSGNTPGDFAVRALANPASFTFIKMGWPGTSAKDFNLYHRQDLLDTLAIIPQGHRIILGIAYGANDLPAMQPRQVLANILRIACWAHDTARVAEVLIIPIMNRKDRWGFTINVKGEKLPRFNESRLWINAQLHALAPLRRGIKVANEEYSPFIYADGYPDDTVRCADKVHPFDAGTQELGEGTIAHGIASFGKIKVK